MPCVRVSAPAHLHVGNYELTCNLGRCMGTVGVAVEQPRLVLRVCTSTDTQAYTVTSDRWCRELEGFAKSYAETLSRLFGSGLRVELLRCYPWGAGLGARTALALSIAAAACKLTSCTYRLEELALELGRSGVSALGFYSFTRGGFIVDAGFEKRLKGCEVPPLLYHWVGELPIVIVTPTTPLGYVRRLKEEVEPRGFPPADELFTSRVSRLVLQALAWLSSGNVERAFSLLSEANRMLGEYWSRLGQRGVYCCSESEEAIRALKEAGCTAVFQSSWGPTVWCVARSPWEARCIAGRARRLESRIGEVLVWATRMDVKGAVLVEEPGRI